MAVVLVQETEHSTQFTVRVYASIFRVEVQAPRFRCEVSDQTTFMVVVRCG